jgi:hypothetical protein
MSTQYRRPSTQPYPGTWPFMVSPLYRLLAPSSSSKNQKGIVWVPGVMKGASISKRIQRGAESVGRGPWVDDGATRHAANSSASEDKCT